MPIGAGLWSRSFPILVLMVCYTLGGLTLLFVRLTDVSGGRPEVDGVQDRPNGSPVLRAGVRGRLS